MKKKVVLVSALLLSVFLPLFVAVVAAQSSDLWQEVRNPVALGDINALRNLYDGRKLDIDYEFSEQMTGWGRGSLLHHAIQSLDTLQRNKEAEAVIYFALERCANTNIRIAVRKRGNVDESLLQLTPMEFFRHEKVQDEQDLADATRPGSLGGGYASDYRNRIAIFERLINRFSNQSSCSKASANPTSVVVPNPDPAIVSTQRSAAPTNRKPQPQDVEVVSTTDWVEDFFIQDDTSKIIMIRNNSKKRWIVIKEMWLHNCENVAVKCSLTGGPTLQGGGWNLPPDAIGAFIPTMRSDSAKPMKFQYYYYAEFKK